MMMFTRRSVILQSMLATCASAADAFELDQDHIAGSAFSPGVTPSPENPAKRIDLKNYKLQFKDDFETASIVADGGNGRWFAPIHSDFGKAKFLRPSDTGPFSVRNGNLEIQAVRESSGWTSGLLQTTDSKGRGFSQQLGYFEVRANFPNTTATWPAVWLLNTESLTNPKAPRVEIDIIECYGNRSDRLHYSVHVVRPGQKRETRSKQVFVAYKPGTFHTYGVEITRDWVIFYFDRLETYRIRAIPEFNTPLYMLIDLGMTEHGLAVAPSPATMLIDYARIYRPA